MRNAVSICNYDATQKFPRDELYGLTSHLRRAAVSVASNIAEGKGRASDKEVLHFLTRHVVPSMSFKRTHPLIPLHAHSIDTDEPDPKAESLEPRARLVEPTGECPEPKAQSRLTLLRTVPIIRESTP